jgi:hypothetical protein
MAEIYSRRIKAVTGDGTGSLKITPTPGKRVFSIQTTLIYAGGTNTLAALMTALTEIRARVGTDVKWRLNGTQLRDYMLLHGTTYDFNGTPNTTGAQVTFPFAPEWFLENVQDSLAWNPALLGGDITLEIDSTASLTCVAVEQIADDLNAPSSGIITLEMIKPVAGGTAFFVEKEIDANGRLILASIYPDSGGSNEITPASMFVGSNDTYAHEALSSAQNDEQLERKSLTPAASGRTANIYDIAFVKGDQLNRGIDMGAWGNAKLKVEAASAMSGTCSILLARLMPK